MAYVIAPDGTPGSVDDAELSKALAQGYRVREPDAEDLARAEAADSPITAGVESIVRTVVPVAGQEILTGFEQGYTGQSEDEVLRGQQLRKEENPVSSALGSGLGFAVGPAKLLKPVLAPLRAAGILGGTAAGAVEGGLFGLEEAVNESMVDQTPLTSEKVAASMAGAALTGGAIDFGMGALAKGGSALVRSMGSKGLKDGIDSLGDNLIKNQIVSKAQLNKYGTAENIDEIIAFGKKEGIFTPASTHESVAEAAKAGLELRKPMYDLILDGLEGAKPAASEAKAILDEVQGALKKYDRGLLAPVAEQQLKRIEAVILQKGVTWRELHDIQSKLFAEIPPTGAASGVKKVLDDMQGALQQSITKRIDDNIAALAAPRAAVSKLGATVNQRMPTSPLPPELAAMGVGTEGAMKKLSREWAQLKRIEAMATDQAKSAAARGLGAKEMMFAGAAGIAQGGPVGAGVALGGAYLGKQVRERGGYLIGGALNRLAESGALEKVASSFQRNVLQRLARAPELLGPFRYTLEQAASQGAMDLLETHVSLMNSRQGPAYARSMGIVGDPSAGNVVNQKLAAYDAINRATVEYDKSLESAVSGVFGTSPGRKGSLGTSGLTAKGFENTMANVRQMLKDPEGMYSRIPAEMRGAAPGTVGTTAATLMNAARFLDSKAPKAPDAGMPVALAAPWQPSAADLDRFNRYKEAVESPAKVLKNMANGYIAKEQVEAIQAVYPTIYQDLKEKISERMMTYKKPLTFQQKQAFSAILGTPIGMSQTQMQILQGLQQQSTQPPGGGSVKQDGRQKVDQEKNMETQAQRLERR